MCGCVNETFMTVVQHRSLQAVRTETHSSVLSLSVEVAVIVWGSLWLSCVNSVGHAVTQLQMRRSSERNLLNAKIWPHTNFGSRVKLPIHVRTWPWTWSVSMIVAKPTHFYVTGRNFSILVFFAVAKLKRKEKVAITGGMHCVRENNNKID